MGAFIDLVPALGEELGWRGCLLPELLPLGTLPALLIRGVVRGMWHAPLVLLRYDYPERRGGSVRLHGGYGRPGRRGLRLAAPAVGIVWPAALAHAAFNAAAGSYLLFAAAVARVDTTQATVLCWSGWTVPLALVVVLVATG